MIWWRIREGQSAWIYEHGLDPDQPTKLFPRQLVEIGPFAEDGLIDVDVSVWSPDGGRLLHRGKMSVFIAENYKVMSPLTPLEMLVVLLPGDGR